MEAKEILEQLWAIAMADVADFVQVKDGALTVRDTADIPDSRAVASVEKSSTGIKIKFYDKLRALELLGKYLGLFDSSAPRDCENNNLLEAIVAAASQEVTYDIPDTEQAATAGYDLVGKTEAERP